MQQTFLGDLQLQQVHNYVRATANCLLSQPSELPRWVWVYAV